MKIKLLLTIGTCLVFTACSETNQSKNSKTEDAKKVAYKPYSTCTTDDLGGYKIGQFIENATCEAYFDNGGEFSSRSTSLKKNGFEYILSITPITKMISRVSAYRYATQDEFNHIKNVATEQYGNDYQTASYRRFERVGYNAESNIKRYFYYGWGTCREVSEDSEYRTSIFHADVREGTSLRCENGIRLYYHPSDDNLEITLNCKEAENLYDEEYSRAKKGTSKPTRL